MRKKLYAIIAVFLLVVAAGIIIFGINSFGVFSKNRFIVRAQVCSACPPFEIVSGSYRLSSMLPDSADKPDVTQAFLTGKVNPYEADYTKTYDYFLITGGLTDIKRMVDGGSHYPVINVTEWQEADIGQIWIITLLFILSLFLSFKFYRKFVNANQVSVLEQSVKTKGEFTG